MENNTDFNQKYLLKLPCIHKLYSLKEFSCSSSPPWSWEPLLPCVIWKGKNFSELCRPERRPGINKFRGTDLVQGTAGNMRESKFCDKSLMKFLSYAAFGGNPTTVRLLYLWETGTWKISSSCQAGSTHSCSSCTGGHLEKESRAWTGGGSWVALRGTGGGVRG